MAKDKGMVISIEHIICRVITNDDIKYFKNKICFVKKRFWGDNLDATCTFLTTCTVNNTKLKAQQKNTFEGMKVSHLALESKTDSYYIL